MSIDEAISPPSYRQRSAHKNNTRDIRKLISQCQKITLDTLAEGLDQTLTLMDDALFAQADKARDGVEQTLFLETMQNIRRKRSLITRPFYQSVSDAFREFPPGPPATDQDTNQPANIDIYSAGLLDTKSHERMVLVANLTNRTKERCKEALYALEQRLTVLNNNHTLTEKNNPLNPQYIVESFLKAIEPAELNDEMKVDIYRLFDEMVMKRLDDVYQNINILLIKAGILPDLQFGRKTEDTRRTAAHIPARTAQTVKSDIQEPLPAAADIASETAPVQTPSPTKMQNSSADSLIELLAHVQNTATNNSPAQMQPSGFASNACQPLIEALENSGINTRTLPYNDKSRVSLIGRLFETINQDSLLGNDYKNLLSKLSLPWALLALNSEQQRESLQPATQLLNEIANAASLYQGTQLFSKDLYRQCESVIKALADSQYPDTDNLHELLKDFQTYISGLKRKSERLEQRNIEVSQGLESLQNAREQASESIRVLSEGHQLQPFCTQFLQSIWTDLLTFYNLRKHNEDERQELQQLTTDLVAALSDRKGNLEAMVPRITSTLMMLGSYRDNVITALIDELVAEHRDQRPGDTGLLDQLHKPPCTGLKQPTPTKPETETATNPVTENLLSRVEPGICCHVLNDEKGTGEYKDQKVLTWKFAWRSQNGQHFLFVDGSGQKTALPDRTTLSEWVENGRLQFLEDKVPSLLSRTLSKLKTK